MPHSERKPPAEFSKTKRKNAMHALQELGKVLVDLPEWKLAKIDLPEVLLEAIHAAHSLKSHQAQRRHLQYIGKLMRDVDPEPILAALKRMR